MDFPFIATKTFLPTRPRVWIERQRLLSRRDEGLEPGKKLILLSAPPGYGKTGLAGEWCAQKLSRATPPGVRFSWLSLESSDNDLVRFLHYLVHTFQNAFPACADWLLAALQSPQPPLAEAFLTSLIEPLSAREIEVLHLIASDCSNKEIAQQLVIALSTVKQHLNHILGKLAAANRTQGVAKARALHLIS